MSVLRHASIKTPGARLSTVVITIVSIVVRGFFGLLRTFNNPYHDPQNGVGWVLGVPDTILASTVYTKNQIKS